MKNYLLIFVILFSASMITCDLFAQGPADPGDDPFSSLNLQKVIAPKDSMNYKKTDISKVPNFRKLKETAFVQPFSKENKIYYFSFMAIMNTKTFEIKSSF